MSSTQTTRMANYTMYDVYDSDLDDVDVDLHDVEYYEPYEDEYSYLYAPEKVKTCKCQPPEKSPQEVREELREYFYEIGALPRPIPPAPQSPTSPSRWQTVTTKLKRTGNDFKSRLSTPPSSPQSPTFASFRSSTLSPLRSSFSSVPLPGKRWLGKAGKKLSLQDSHLARVDSTTSSTPTSPTLCDPRRDSGISVCTILSDETVVSKGTSTKKVQFDDNPTYIPYQERIVPRFEFRPGSIHEKPRETLVVAQHQYPLELLAKVYDARRAQAALPPKLVFEDPVFLPWPSNIDSLPKQIIDCMPSPTKTNTSFFDDDEEEEQSLVASFTWTSIRCKIECEIITLGIWLFIWFCIFMMLLVHIIRVVLRIR